MRGETRTQIPGKYKLCGDDFTLVFLYLYYKAFLEFQVLGVLMTALMVSVR